MVRPGKKKIPFICLLLLALLLPFMNGNASPFGAGSAFQEATASAKLSQNGLQAPLEIQNQFYAAGSVNNMGLKTTAVTDSAVSLTWDKIPGATGYNLYNGSTKINAAPIVSNFYCVIRLTQNTYYALTITAVVSGMESAKSDVYYAATRQSPITGTVLPSGAGKQVMPYSDIALHMQFIGPAMSDPNYYYWCISPIDGDDGKTHLFVSRWAAQNTYGGMGGWQYICEITHCVGDSPEGPFHYVDTAISNKDLPTGQFSPHNVRIKKIDDVYAMIFITQGSGSQKDQKIDLATSDSLNGPWTLQGDNHDGIVVRPDATGWTANSWIGTDNPDILKFNGQYLIYFKSGVDMGSTHYGYAVSDTLTSGYVKCGAPITDNISYIEDVNAFEMNGKAYLLTTDNFGNNTGVMGYGILWQSDDGKSFKLADAQVGFGLLTDYTAIPPYAVAAYGNERKFERPAILFRDGKPAYFYGASGCNIDGNNCTENYVCKITDGTVDPSPQKAVIHFDAGGGTGTMADGSVFFGVSYSIPACGFTKAGATFAGWTASGAVVGDFTDRDTVKYIIGDVTLTARWQ